MMNRQRRRQQAAIQRHNSARCGDEGSMMVGSNSAIDDDVKADIARVVRSIIFKNADGGTCMWRNGIGYMTLRLLGFKPTVCVGGMLFRAGQDPLRDTVSFCGPGNKGQLVAGHFVGHIWLEMDSELIDFTGADWPSLDADTIELDNLGTIQWKVRPPVFVWATRKLFTWQATGHPKLGEHWYGPWHGEPLPDLFDELIQSVAPFGHTIITNLLAAKLPERLGISLDYNSTEPDDIEDAA
jgi:hypothetical protein